MEAHNTRDLIAALQAELRRQLQRSAELRDMPLEKLQQRPDPKRWSVMEVLQHMNLSSDHYHRHLERIYANEHNGLRFRTAFVPGWWGDRATRAMDVRPDGRIRFRMPTIARFEPRATDLEGWQALDRFEAMCHGFIGLLERAKTRGLEGERVTSTLGPILRLKAGDAFRFPIAHQRRHWLQIEKTLEKPAR
jgi:hypothetical protein